MPRRGCAGQSEGAELQRIEAGGSVDNELLDTIELIIVILGGLKGEGENGE